MAALDERDSERVAAKAKAKAKSMSSEGDEAAKEPRAKANAKSGSEKTGGQTASVLKRLASAQAPANPSSYSACHERRRSQIYVGKVGGGKGSCSLFKYGPGMKYKNEKSAWAAVEKFMA